MIHRLSESIAYFYGEKVNYSKDKIEVCAYGLEIIISDVIVLFIAILISLLTKTFIHTIILLAVFVLLRHQVGGFHASSHFRCNMIFFVAYISAIGLIKGVPNDTIEYLVMCFGIVGVLAILKYAPVGHPNKPVSKKRKEKFRKTGIIMVIIFFVLSILLVAFFSDMERYALSITFGIFYAGMSIIAEIYKRHLNKLTANQPKDIHC